MMNHSFLLFLVKRIPGISGGNISIYARIPDRPSREREHSSAALPKFPHAETSQSYFFFFVRPRKKEKNILKVARDTGGSRLIHLHLILRKKRELQSPEYG